VTGKNNPDFEDLMNDNPSSPSDISSIKISAGEAVLEGNLEIPDPAKGVVVFAYGSGSSRLSPRNRTVARSLRKAGLGTLLFDLLTFEEERADLRDGHLRFNIPFLSERLIAVTEWLSNTSQAQSLSLGYFGASTGAAAALLAASLKPDLIRAIVSRGGRPDLAGAALPKVKAPTLLIVGGDDLPVIGMNQKAMERLKTEKEMMIVPGASHLFEEPGTLEEVARLAARWFTKYLTVKPKTHVSR
jgi:putative phosphoribosyl transferase